MTDENSHADSADLQALRQRLDGLERSIERTRGKDGWDKIAAVAPFVSGVVIGAIGIYATAAYNNRQLESNALQKEQEIAALQVQTVETFFDHLSSQNQSLRKSALEAIAALGNLELASQLAVNFGGPAGEAFLDTLAFSADPEVSAKAAQALDALNERRARSVDLELTHRLALFHDLILDQSINDLVMSELGNVFEETPPAQQDYMIGGSRYLLDEHGSRTLLALLYELQDVAPAEREDQIVSAIAAAKRFQSMIVSTPKRQVALAEHIVGDVPDFDTADVTTIRAEIIPAFAYWLELQAGNAS